MSIKKSRNKWLIAASMVMVAFIYSVTLVSTLAPKTAEAAGCAGSYSFGRQKFCGYFFNHEQDFGGFVINGGGATCRGGTMGIPLTVDSAAKFIAFMDTQLRGKGASPAQNKTGAEFIIETMLGKQGPAGRKASADIGGADYNTWVTDITQYDAAHLINWDFSYNMTSSTVNSFYQTADNDDAFFPGDGGCPGANQTIEFHSPSNVQLYVIRRECGNPLGAVNGLVPLIQPYTLKLSLTPGTGTPAYTSGPNTGIVEPGKTYHLTAAVTNPSATKADPLVMEVENLTPAYLSNAGVTGGGQTTFAGYMGAACQSGVSPCWRWNFGNGLTKDSTSTETNGVSFTVSAATPQGTKVCFRGYISPGTQNAGSKITTAIDCFLVYTPVLPAVVGNNGDVHAGGGLCDAATLSNGSVTGYAGAGSGGEYVVSASSAITNFGSNGAPSGAAGDTSLLGSSGGYAQVCREDLLNGPNGANAYYSASGARGAGTYSVTGWASGVYYFNGSITLSGVVSSKITVVERSGNVTIGSPGISLSVASLPIAQLPSLGIIASGDIDINNTVTLVDAYLFADGNINTCVQANATCATATLVVNGFLMAKDINLQRLGASAAKGATVAEQVNLNPQIYLNPPRFFDASVDDTPLVGQGEAPPLF